MQRLRAAPLPRERLEQRGLQRHAPLHIEVGLREQLPREFFHERPAVRLFGNEQKIKRRIEPLLVPVAPVIGGQQLDGAPERVRTRRNRRGPHVNPLRHRRRARARAQRHAVFAGLEINVRRRAPRAARAVAEIPLHLRRVQPAAVRLEPHEMQRQSRRAQRVVHAPRERHRRRALRALNARGLGARGGREETRRHRGGREFFVRGVALQIERAVRAARVRTAHMMHLERMHARLQLDLAPRGRGNARGETRRARLLENAVRVDEQKRRVLRADEKFVRAILGNAQETAVGRGEIARVVGSRGIHVLHHLLHKRIADHRRTLLQARDDIRPTRERRTSPIAELDRDALGQRRDVGVRQFRIARVRPVARVAAVALKLNQRFALGLMREHRDRQHATVLRLHANVRAIGPQPARGGQAREDGLRGIFFTLGIPDQAQRKPHAIARHPRGRGQRRGWRGGNGDRRGDGWRRFRARFDGRFDGRQRFRRRPGEPNAGEENNQAAHR